ncbi:MAG: hypothetical protein M3N93_15565 [Acidobacteriota bacterium]|nr:hypothetical protein [Acidobacteriota bacterium]
MRTRVQLLRSAQDRIINWWASAYRNAPDALLGARFVVEAAASLPAMASPESHLTDVYAAMSLQRMRLKNDQQVPEWMGELYLGP